MADAWLIELPLVTPHASAVTTTTTRQSVIIRLDDGELSGWGEAAPIPGYTTETVHDVWDSLAGDQPLPATAAAALEAAAADLLAKQRGDALWRVIGGVRPTVEAGAVVSLGTTDEVLRRVAADVAAGYTHVKLKIAPDRDLATVGAVRTAFPDLSLGVDGNGAYSANPELTPLDEFGLAYVEQPFTELAQHADLAAELDTPLSLDESIRSAADARRAIELDAVDIFSVKPSLLGLAVAIEIHDIAVDNGIGLRLGGMLETGVGRAHALAAASLPGFNVPGDLGASNRYFDRDITDPPWTLTSAGNIELPDVTGIGVIPNPDFLNEIAIRSPLKF